MNILEIDELGVDPVKEGILCKNCMILMNDLFIEKRAFAIFTPIGWKTITKTIYIIKPPPGHERTCEFCSTKVDDYPESIFESRKINKNALGLSDTVTKHLDEEWKNAG